jgi:hypothetical protein
VGGAGHETQFKAVGVNQYLEESSFLKKRSKRLLSLRLRKNRGHSLNLGTVGDVNIS